MELKKAAFAAFFFASQPVTLDFTEARRCLLRVISKAAYQIRISNASSALSELQLSF